MTENRCVKTLIKKFAFVFPKFFPQQISKISQDFYNAVKQKGEKEKIQDSISIINNCIVWRDYNNHIHFVSLEEIKNTFPKIFTP